MTAFFDLISEIESLLVVAGLLLLLAAVLGTVQSKWIALSLSKMQRVTLAAIGALTLTSGMAPHLLDQTKGETKAAPASAGLIGALLDTVTQSTVSSLRESALQWRCNEDFARPKAKAELLAYLYSSEDLLRRRVATAYAACAGSIHDAFILARAVRADEDAENLSDLAFAIWVVLDRFASETHRAYYLSQLYEFLQERGAAAELSRRIRDHEQLAARKEMGGGGE